MAFTLSSLVSRDTTWIEAGQEFIIGTLGVREELGRNMFFHFIIRRLIPLYLAGVSVWIFLEGLILTHKPHGGLEELWTYLRMKGYLPFYARCILRVVLCMCEVIFVYKMWHAIYCSYYPTLTPDYNNFPRLIPPALHNV
ncbi:hypothetical protein F5Y09DRAFT_173550 [Xylaria sp. FL1042]|nr:hypothetical protein F5Y09DRAFT_173550 [Xylaria sp. FL1042]